MIERVEASALPGEERHFLESLIAHPDTPEQLAAAANSPEEAAQVYLAAFIAIDADTPAEAAWLDDLANKLASIRFCAGTSRRRPRYRVIL